ncbi:MAG: hypothetical protein MRY83_01440, partial [Flavobacteriales bacterium]|nr:hypothetical protein [Flavobacteriales bacterium]
MNKVVLTFVLFLNFALSYGQGPNCQSSTPFCTGQTYTFPANYTGTGPGQGPQGQPGPNYDCLTFQPNPAWFYLEIDQPGNLDFTITNSSGVDLDFIVWGPYNDPFAPCPNGFQNVVDCSYDPFAFPETPSIPFGNTGDVFVIMITNFANVATNVSFSQSGGTGSTDCSIISCTMTNVSATPGACDPNTQTFDITGQVFFNNPPATGQLIIETCSGDQTIINAPFVSPASYVIPGVNADGTANCIVDAYFTDDPACMASSAPFTEPNPCPPPCIMNNLAVNVGACDPNTNLFDINGSVSFTNPPITGQLIIEDCNGNQTTVNAPFISPINYSITGINSDGTPGCYVTAYFTDDPTCTITTNGGNNHNNPNPCICNVDAGTYSAFMNGTGSINYVLCENNGINLLANNDQVWPPDLGAGFPANYNPGVEWFAYACPPTPGLPPTADPCYVTSLFTFGSGNFFDVNNPGVVGSFPPGTFPNNTVYFVPVIMYDVTTQTINGACWDMGQAIPVTYLNPIQNIVNEDCPNNLVDVVLWGGDPEANGTLFQAFNLQPANAGFVNSVAPNNGVISITGLQDGDFYSFDVVDNNGCTITISGGPFDGPPTVNAGPDLSICQGQSVNLSANGDASVIAYNWTPAGSLNNPNSANPTATPNATTTYTVSVFDGSGCSNSDDVTVVVDAPNDAGTDGAIILCSSDPSVDLFNSLGGTPDVGGTWTPALTSGTGVFNPAVDVAGTYTYTVPANGACPSASSIVNVSVRPAVDAGINGNISLCTTDPSVDLFNVLGGTPDVGGTWTPALISGTGVFDPAIDVGGTYTYTVLGTNPCPNANATVTVTVNSPNDPGTNGTITLCSSDASVDLFNSLGGAPDVGGIWAPALTSGTGVFDPAVDAAGTYTYTVPANGNCPAASADVVVTINAAVDAGVNGNISLCTTDPSTDLFNVLGGTPDVGGTWSPALVSGTGVFDPAVDAGGTYTYTVLGTNPCPNANATVTVTLNTPNNPGINGAITLCSSDPSVDLFNSLGGTPDVGGTWAPALTSGAGVFDPAADAAGTYTYTVPTNGNCPAASADVVVTVNTAVDAGINGNISLCITDPSTDLFNSLGGTPDIGGTWTPALTSGTGIFDPAFDVGGTYTYTVLGVNPCPNATAVVTVALNAPNNPGINGAITLCSSDLSVDLFNSLGGTPDPGGTWTPALTSGTGIFDPAVDAAGTYTYTVPANGNCPAASADVVVTINAAVDAGGNGNISLCTTDPSTDLLNVLGGTPDAGGTWSPALVSGTGVFDPAVDAAGTYTYTVLGANPCPNATATVTVIVNSPNDPGTNGAITLCSTGAATDLFNSLGGTPGVGGTWSPALTSGTGVFDPAVDVAGTYTYTVPANGNCPVASADVVVTVNTAPDAGGNGAIILCVTGGTTDLFTSLIGTPDAGGTWSPALVSGTGVFDPAVDAAGTYTYTVSGGGICPDALADVVVTVTNLPDAGTNGAITLCQTDPSADLFNSLGGTPNLGGTWSPALASGTGVFDPAVDAAGTYTYTVGGTGGCPNVSADVVVTVNTPPDAGGN